ncbi:MBL fold metallo-hydrolase [Vibrio lentus]|uniref:MBL fold metallo-hydrolase n=1 Tax=Vibrio lentus TaxID=136468 RepID=UPI000C837141|nr:MBL fold metallo-hydrolase [Vibrio lentus]
MRVKVMKVRVLQAKNGDSFLLSCNDVDGIERYILIDGGKSSTYQYKGKKNTVEDGPLKVLVDSVPQVDLLVLTHIDDDHIAGILKWFEGDENACEKVKKIWFNSGPAISKYLNIKDVDKSNELLEPILKKTLSTDTSVRQAVNFVNLVKDRGIWNESIIKSLDIYTLFGLEVVILSPNDEKLRALLTKWEKEDDSLDTSSESDYSKTLKEHAKLDDFFEDNSIPNGSSISFLIRENDKNYLFLSDSHPSVIVESLSKLGISKDEPLRLELVKISHHGSKYNTNDELLQLLDTKKFIFSSNGDFHKLPHKRCVARVVSNNPDAELIFNYQHIADDILSVVDYEDFPNVKVNVVENEDIV